MRQEETKAGTDRDRLIFSKHLSGYADKNDSNIAAFL